jgi:hypothetical protein
LTLILTLAFLLLSYLSQPSAPLAGSSLPSTVYCTVKVDIKPLYQDSRMEWDNLREGDVVYLLALKASSFPRKTRNNDSDKDNDMSSDDKGSLDLEYVFGSDGAVSSLRGAQVVAVYDTRDNRRSDSNGIDGSAGSTGLGKGRDFEGTIRQLRLQLDSAQYEEDRRNGQLQVYTDMNCIVRRSGRENNTRALLESTRTLLLQSSNLDDGIGKPVFPLWLEKAFVGGNMYEGETESKSKSISKTSGENMKISDFFTLQQSKAIETSVKTGLSVVVGPPGSGKTDVAVQCVTHLYSTEKDGRILLLAHSNAALDALFTKITQRGIAGADVIRLGGGSSEARHTRSMKDPSKSNVLVSEHDFTREGRLNWALHRRIQLLQGVQRLAVSLKAPGDVWASCETAAYFYSDHVTAVMEKWQLSLKKKIPVGFPFATFFDVNEKMPIHETEHLISQIKQMFSELETFRPLELLRSQRQREDYWLAKEVSLLL